MNSRFQYRIISTGHDIKTVSDMPCDQFLSKGVKETARDMSFRWRPDHMAVYVRADDDAAWIPIHGAVDPRPTTFPMPPIRWDQMSWYDYHWLGRQLLAAYQASQNSTIENLIVSTKYEIYFKFTYGIEISREEFMSIVSSRIYLKLQHELPAYLGEKVCKSHTREQIREITSTLYVLKIGA